MLKKLEFTYIQYVWCVIFIGQDVIFNMQETLRE